MIYVAKFVVLSCLVCRAGYVEHAKRPGERVTSFKLAELASMAYVHQGALQTWLGFQVTDIALTSLIGWVVLGCSGFRFSLFVDQLLD